MRSRRTFSLRDLAKAIRPCHVTVLVAIAPGGDLGAQQDEGGPPLLSPGAHDFSRTPVDPTEYEVRWISRPESAEADTGFVYMKAQDFLSEGTPHLRIEWVPLTSSVANMDLILLDPRTYAVRYRLEPRAGGGYGIFWFEDGRAYAANVDSDGNSIRSEITLERPVFSVPSLPWVLAQLAGRVGREQVRLELPGFSADGEGEISDPILEPGPRREHRMAESDETHLAREMTVRFRSGVSWTYLVSEESPYFLGITARSPEGVVTSLIEVVRWARPALDPSRRFPERGR